MIINIKKYNSTKISQGQIRSGQLANDLKTKCPKRKQNNDKKL